MILNLLTFMIGMMLSAVCFLMAMSAIMKYVKKN